MTADIPKIARTCGAGIVTLAQMSGRPIVPVAVVTSRRIDFKSWDRASLGLPFGRGAIVLGDPFMFRAMRTDETREGVAPAGGAGPRRVHERAYALVGAQDPGRSRDPREHDRPCCRKLAAMSLPFPDALLSDRDVDPRTGRARPALLASAQGARGSDATGRTTGLSEPRAADRTSGLGAWREHRRDAVAASRRGAPDAARADGSGDIRNTHIGGLDRTPPAAGRGASISFPSTSRATPAVPRSLAARSRARGGIRNLAQHHHGARPAADSARSGECAHVGPLVPALAETAAHHRRALAAFRHLPRPDAGRRGAPRVSWARRACSSPAI